MYAIDCTVMKVSEIPGTPESGQKCLEVSSASLTLRAFFF